MEFETVIGAIMYLLDLLSMLLINNPYNGAKMLNNVTKMFNQFKEFFANM